MARKCAEWHQDTPSGKKRCARFDEAEADVILAKGQEGEDVGYFDITEVQDAVGSIGRIEAPDVVAPLLGGSLAIGATLLTRRYSTSANLTKYAPFVGAAAGIVGSIPLYFWGRGGEKAVISGAMTSAAVGGGLFAFEWLASNYLAGGETGLISAERRLGEAVASGGGANLLPAARVPAAMRPAIDVEAFAGGASY